jgi:hypothetical protein
MDVDPPSFLPLRRGKCQVQYEMADVDIVSFLPKEDVNRRGVSKYLFDAQTVTVKFGTGHIICMHFAERLKVGGRCRGYDKSNGCMGFAGLDPVSLSSSRVRAGRSRR